MADIILATLGPIVFGIKKAAFQELVREAEGRWAKMERLGNRPARQWIGIGDDTINLRGVVFPAFNGAGKWTIEDMRQAMLSGIPYQFIDGGGHVWGLYCIESVRQTDSSFLGPNKPRKQEFDVKLGAYGEDNIADQGAIINGDPAGPRTGSGSGLA